MKGIECLIFDFGNVIGFFDHKNACLQLAKLSKIQLNADKIYEKIFKMEGIEEQYDRGGISSSSFISEIKQLFNIEAEAQEVEKAWCDIFWPNDAVISLIPLLRAVPYRLILASNTNELHHNWFRREFADTVEHFHAQVLSYQEKCRKPEKTFFQKCFEKSGYSASQCAYIDDREDFVVIAQELGMKGIVYKSYHRLIKNLGELGVKGIETSQKE